jgi:hypothetical protein
MSEMMVRRLTQAAALLVGLSVLMLPLPPPETDAQTQTRKDVYSGCPRWRQSLSGNGTVLSTKASRETGGLSPMSAAEMTGN